MKRLCIVFLTFAILFATMAYDAQSRGKDDRASNTAKGRLYMPLSNGGSDTIVDPIINWPTFYGVQQTGEIDAVFNCFGHFGAGFLGGLSYETVPGWPEANFISPSGSGVEYLWAGAIWVGGIRGTDTLVSVGADGWQLVREMFPPEYPSRGSVTKFDYPADFSMRAEFYDTITAGIPLDYFGRPHIPLDIRIVNRSHIWRSDPYNWTVIYDMVIANIGDELIEQGYVGFYFDGDVCFDCSSIAGYTDDVTGFIPSEGIAYIIDNDGDLTTMPPEQQTPRILAFKFLETSFPPAHTSFNWWLSHGDPSLDFGPRQKPTPDTPFRDFGTGGGLGTPEGDVNKYYVMSFQEWDYDQVYTAIIPPDDTLWLYPDPIYSPDYADGYDTRFLMSIGLFDLLPDSSVRILFATFTADSVHTDPNNIDNLPYNPDQYMANLDFSRVLENAGWSDSLSHTLLNPELPVTGLQVEYKDDDSVIVRWDPWVFDDVEGFEVYLWEVPSDSLPYPGVAPPWLEPDQFNPVASLGRTHECVFDALDPGTFYLVNVAHRTTTKSIGDPGEPLAIKLGDRSVPPVVDKEYVYLQEGGPAVLTWTAPEKATVDHYNIYRFENADAAAKKFHAFYDEGFHAQFITPKDSFSVDGQCYYYYAMDVYAQVPGNVTDFTDTGVDEGTVYVLTAIDEYGFESGFSIDITALVVEPRTKDVLVITKPAGFRLMMTDSVTAFYDSILSGYSYDIYYYADSINVQHCPTLDARDCVNWHDFMRYRLVVVDDGIREQVVGEEYEDDTKGFTRYLLSGGKLAYFGSFGALLNFSSNTDTGYYPASHWFIQRFFGVDSVFDVGYGFFKMNDLPLVDTFFAFSKAEAVGSIPNLSYDTTRYPFASVLQNYWPTNTPPSVSTFKVNDDGETIHLFKALPGVSSMNENEPVGVITNPEGTETYLFGFHLWYMTYTEGQALINAIMMPAPKVVISPDTMFAFYAHTIDTIMAKVYFGDFSEGYLPSDIVPASVRINDSIVPTSWAILPSYPGFTGQVMEIVFPINEFLEGYGIFYDTTLRAFSVSGEFSDSRPFVVNGRVTLIGHRSGDLNGDGAVNVADLTYLVDYLFGSGPAPCVEDAGDVDGNCTTNVADIGYLVNYLYGGGPAPVSCPQ
jgi:hypothetical protein